MDYEWSIQQTFTLNTPKYINKSFINIVFSLQSSRFMHRVSSDMKMFLLLLQSATFSCRHYIKSKHSIHAFCINKYHFIRCVCIFLVSAMVHEAVCPIFQGLSVFGLMLDATAQQIYPKRHRRHRPNTPIHSNLYSVVTSTAKFFHSVIIFICLPPFTWKNI